jgi:hypothetical protein
VHICIPALRRLRQEDHEFKDSLGFFSNKQTKEKHCQFNVWYTPII